MTVEIKCVLTWQGMNKAFAQQSEKKIKRSLKDISGADDVEIIEINSWEEDEED